MTIFSAVRVGAAVAVLALAVGGCATQSAVSGAAPASSAAASAARTTGGASPAAPVTTSPAPTATPTSPAPSAPTATSTSTSPGAPTAGAVPSTIAGTVFLNPALVSAGTGLYLRWDLKQGQQAPPPAGLARVDPATGRILAVNTSLPGTVGRPVFAAGSLWVTDAASDGEFLLRLNPLTLAVTGRVKITSGKGIGGFGGHIAFAGGLVWADGANRLVAVSPSAMSVRRAITFPHANDSDAMASADGTTLIVSEAVSGNGSVQRRDPVTGALLASVPMLGVVAPILGGVTSGGVWISEPTGMMGYVERLDAATLAAGAATRVRGTNGIRVDLWDGELWVSNQGGGPSRNYCADPANGRRLATSPLPDLVQDFPMTVVGHRMYYSVSVGNGFKIRTVPVPAACG